MRDDAPSIRNSPSSHLPHTAHVTCLYSTLLLLCVCVRVSLLTSCGCCLFAAMAFVRGSSEHWLEFYSRHLLYIHTHTTESVPSIVSSTDSNTILNPNKYSFTLIHLAFEHTHAYTYRYIFGVHVADTENARYLTIHLHCFGMYLFNFAQAKAFNSTGDVIVSGVGCFCDR